MKTVEKIKQLLKLIRELKSENEKLKEKIKKIEELADQALG